MSIPPFATSVAITTCETRGCDCGSVWIELIDDTGEVIAVAPYGPEQIPNLINGLTAARQSVMRNPQVAARVQSGRSADQGLHS